MQREREIGDLKALDRLPILRIDFGKGNSITASRDELLHYFRKNGCPCKDKYSQKCKVGMNYFAMIFNHLAHLERANKKLMVFKGNLYFIFKLII